MEFSKEELELILGGLGCLVHDTRYSSERQYEAQLIGKKIAQALEAVTA